MTREEIIEANPIVDYLCTRGHSLARAGENFVTSGCPVTQHKRGHRPVMIYPSTQTWYCHDCKRGGTAIDWEMIEKDVSATDAMQILGGGRNSEVRKPKGKIVATYDYQDEDGNMLFQTVRFEPKDFSQRRPDGKGGWTFNIIGVRRVLYRLPEVIEAQRVAIAEGEKDCDNLAALGFVATTNPLGAEKWRDEYSETLRGKDVVIFGDVGDADLKGERHVEQVIESLSGKAHSIKRVTLPDGYHDVSDYIASLPAKTAAEAIAKLVEETHVVDPRSSLGGDEPPGDYSTNLTSLPSLSAVDYPTLLDEAAYHGLAGEIVRRILPHTEADPAALLFQSLAAFGNLIGHDHYIVADGGRHYLNLYGVLVGQSSKGRKGTSWNHIANVMERVEPEWRQDRVTNGLSSGEGLIWAVRDPIEETRPIREKGRYTGEYETYIANHGEADKRLFVLEAEFANVLKVMAREGNTISPVIRCAWDSGDLKTMVKNSPAKATGAHISIVGHITRDERRRLLTQTESANGFANRFCWLAVKRSKCLPDGGAIDTVNFDDVVAKLEAALNFAKDFVEIVRGPETKKLWHEVYPRLSEAQPGMSGAVIGRAEAQVMRLSAIYALLDQSHLIRPEHHEAAMALWRYCEQSTRWIFGTSTGNRNADKILAALRHAPDGMTKTEISVEIFNRHASSAEIDEALRLLYGLGMASYRSEATGGAPVQRWFFSA
jgi:5S rRNA maturation endonuclease (ribonuclease M5)